jgi:hypothetical protein
VLSIDQSVGRLCGRTLSEISVAAR